MIGIDENGKIIIRTYIDQKDYYELDAMRKSVLDLIAERNDDYIDHATILWGIEVVKLLSPEPEQVCLDK